MQYKVSKSKQRGAALITALFITAITAIIATAMALQQRVLIQQTELVLSSDRAYLQLEGLRDQIIMDLLRYKILQQKGQTPSRSDFLPTVVPAQKRDRLMLSGLLRDQQGLFNINNLTKTSEQPAFIRLLRMVLPNLSARQANQITQAITAWMIPGTRDDYYLRQDPPYRAAHQPMVSVSGLRAIQGITAPIYRAIMPYLTALPMKQQAQWMVNINSAPAPVLITLSPKITPAKARALVACRKSHGDFKQINAYNDACVKPLGLPVLTHITTKSQFYLLTTMAMMPQQQVSLTSLLVTGKDKQNKIRVIIDWQSLN